MTPPRTPPISFKAPVTKEIALEFRMARARDSDSKDQVGWGMLMIGLLGDVRHEFYGPILPTYPTGQQFATFCRQARRHLIAWFDSPDYEQASKRAAEKRRSSSQILVLPGGSG